MAAGGSADGRVQAAAPLKQLALVVVLVSGAARAADPDPWFGADKAFHFSASAALAMGGYGASVAFLESPHARLAYGGAVALLAGVGKELWDASGNGDPSWKDLAWDAVGIAVGLAICWALDRLF